MVNSPAIIVNETDLTGSVRNQSSSRAVFIGDFNWGAVNRPTQVFSRSDLVAKFGRPTDANTVDFHTASSFLNYADTLSVIRTVGLDSTFAWNAGITLTQGVAENGDEIPGESDSDFEARVVTNQPNQANLGDNMETLTSKGVVFKSKYIGDFGNSIVVELSPNTSYDTWAYAGLFDSEPDTDEIHVVVTSGAEVLEVFPFASTIKGTKDSNGATNYIINVVNRLSSYVEMITFDADETNRVYTLTGGNTTDITTESYNEAVRTVSDKDAITIDFIIARAGDSASNANLNINSLLPTIEARKDCVIVASPSRQSVFNATPVDAIVSEVSTYNSSYLVMDCNWFNVYDAYNDAFIDIPACGATAGIMARSDITEAPWASPAGVRRGIYNNVNNIAWNPNKQERDSLYKVGVNSIYNRASSGITLFGDKTKLKRPSSFDRINVRRLFIVIERAVALASEQTLFQNNTDFTRTGFVNTISPFLRGIQGRGGIEDFRVVADTSNNTPDVIDANRFKVDIYIKPSISINEITLNFIGTRSSVDFSEITGSPSL